MIYFCLLQVMNFFKKRISEQYPPLSIEEDIQLRSKKQHEAFMIAKAHSVLGRDNILKQVSSTLLSIQYSFNEKVDRTQLNNKNDEC